MTDSAGVADIFNIKVFFVMFVLNVYVDIS